MFASIRRHQKWLFAVIISVVIVSFVIFFTPSSRHGGQRVEGDYGSINGIPITRDEALNARKEAMLMHFFNYGDWPKNDAISRQLGFDVEQESLRRVALTRRLKAMSIEVSDTQVAAQVASIFKDRNTQTFSLPRYQEFLKQTLGSQGLVEADFQRFLKHELAIRHLSAVYGMSGVLLPPRAAEDFYRRENEQLLTSAAFFRATNYLKQVVIQTNELPQFYTNRMAEYRLPERVQVYYIAFESINYLDEAAKQMAAQTNLASMIDGEYLRRGTNIVDAQKKPLPELEAKELIKSEIRDRVALQSARKAANDVAQVLFAQEPLRATNLFAFAAARKLTVKETEPFSQFEGPKSLSVPLTFARQAFALTDEEPFTSPILGEHGVYLVALKQRFPSQPQAFDKVKERLVEDYREYKAQQLAVKAGEQFALRLTNGIPKGSTFAAQCTASGVKPVDVKAISRSTRALPEVEEMVPLSMYREAALDTKTGAVSRFVPAREGGFVLYVSARQPVAEDTLKAALPEYLQNMRENRQGYVFSDWFRRESEAARTVGPAQQAP